MYPKPRTPRVEARAVGLISEAGLLVRSDGKCSFDHGCFVPAHVMYPDASVLAFQISRRVSTWRWATRSRHCRMRGC